MRRALGRATVAERLRLPSMRLHCGDTAEQPGLYPSMPPVPRPDVNHCRHLDAGLQAAVNGMVRGYASDLNQLQFPVGATISKYSRNKILQNGLDTHSEVLAFNTYQNIRGHRTFRGWWPAGRNRRRNLDGDPSPARRPFSSWWALPDRRRLRSNRSDEINPY